MGVLGFELMFSTIIVRNVAIKFQFFQRLSHKFCISNHFFCNFDSYVNRVKAADFFIIGDLSVVNPTLYKSLTTYLW